jgi:hypothetical protein
MHVLGIDDSEKKNRSPKATPRSFPGRNSFGHTIIENTKQYQTELNSHMRIVIQNR